MLRKVACVTALIQVVTVGAAKKNRVGYDAMGMTAEVDAGAEAAFVEGRWVNKNNMWNSHVHEFNPDACNNLKSTSSGAAEKIRGCVCEPAEDVATKADSTIIESCQTLCSPFKGMSQTVLSQQKIYAASLFCEQIMDAGNDLTGLQTCFGCVSAPTSSRPISTGSPGTDVQSPTSPETSTSPKSPQPAVSGGSVAEKTVVTSYTKFVNSYWGIWRPEDPRNQATINRGIQLGRASAGITNDMMYAFFGLQPERRFGDF